MSTARNLIRGISPPPAADAEVESTMDDRTCDEGAARKPQAERQILLEADIQRLYERRGFPTKVAEIASRQDDEPSDHQRNNQ